MSLWFGEVTVEWVNSVGVGTMSDNVGIEVTEIGPDFLRGTMTVTERTIQPARILHGGASVVFAETLASCATAATIDRARYMAVGQEINANHLRPAPLGTKLIGTTRPYHVGRRSQVWGIEIVDEQGQMICISRITMAVVERRPAHQRPSENGPAS
jgi:1,4-dihydroxy-2-naphthoyl-CoA hydrolase